MTKHFPCYQNENKACFSKPNSTINSQKPLAPLDTGFFPLPLVVMCERWPQRPLNLNTEEWFKNTSLTLKLFFLPISAFSSSVGYKSSRNIFTFQKQNLEKSGGDSEHLLELETPRRLFWNPWYSILHNCVNEKHFHSHHHRPIQKCQIFFEKNIIVQKEQQLVRQNPGNTGLMF